MIYVNYCRWYCPFLLCIPQRVLLGGLCAEAAVGFACAGGEGLSSLNTWWAEGASVGCLETNQSSALVGEQPPICPFWGSARTWRVSPTVSNAPGKHNMHPNMDFFFCQGWERQEGLLAGRGTAVVWDSQCRCALAPSSWKVLSVLCQVTGRSWWKQALCNQSKSQRSPK